MNLKDEKIRELCNSYKTPLYLYDGDFLQEHYRQLRARLHPQAAVFLSLKANGNAALAGLFGTMGCGIEVASIGELKVALAAGFQPENILFSGPGKRSEELKFAMKTGIYCIIAESIGEIETLSRIAALTGKKTAVGIRVNPAHDVTTAKIKMGGVPRQFGVDEEQLEEVLQRILEDEWLTFRGIHIYAGTQILEAESILAMFRYTVRLALSLQERYGVRCEMVDLGGGFGVPYFPSDKQLDMNAVLDGLYELIEDHRNLLPDTRYILESGRYLLAEGGAYLTRVTYTKTSKGEKFAVVDGGLHHHQGATFRGRIMRNNYPIRVIAEDAALREETVQHIVGLLCTPEDLLGRQLALPTLEPGDLMVIEKSGAYGLTYSPQQFLGHRSPLELLVLNGEAHVIRKRGEDEDLLRNQVLIRWEGEVVHADSRVAVKSNESTR